MRVIKMYCDRCGNEFKKWNYKHEELIGIAEFVYDDDDPYLGTQKDLCKSCYTELEKWWNLSTKSEKICRCNTCRNNDDGLSGECYECVKNIQNHYEPESEDEKDDKS